MTVGNCLMCGDKLKYYDSVRRIVRTKSRKSRWIIVPRYQCVGCGCIRRYLPDYIYPYKQWFMFDEEKGYHTTAYLGRIARTSDQLSDEENNREVERAIDEIIRFDFQNIYRKVTRKSETKEKVS